MCIHLILVLNDLYKDIPNHKQVPNELIVAQAVVETGWGDSRFANEANNLFGIRTLIRDDNYMLPRDTYKLAWLGCKSVCQ